MSRSVRCTPFPRLARVTGAFQVTPVISSESLAAPLLLAALGAAVGMTGCGVTQSASSSLPAPIAATAGPQLGYFWSPGEHALRPMLGIPGAAQIGKSVVPAGQYLNAAATNHLAVLEDAAGFVVMTLPAGTPVRLQIPAGTGGQQIRISPGGTAALVFAPGGTGLTVVTDLSTTGDATGNQVHTLAAPAPVLDAAVSDLGTTVALNRQQAGAEAVLLSGSGTQSTLVSLQGQGGSLAFLAATASHPDDLLLADATANSLTLIRTVSSAPSAATIATAGLLKSPTAVSASANGHWAAVANSAEASVVRLDLTGQAQPRSIACACQPNAVVPLADDGYFRITGPGTAGALNSPLWIADATTNPRTLFVPGLAGSAATAGQSGKQSSARASLPSGLNGTTTLKVGGR